MHNVVDTPADMSAKKTTRKPAAKPRDGRGEMSVLEQRAFALKQELLLDALKKADWSPTEAGKALGMSKANVLRAIDQLDLTAEYNQHRPKPGPRPKV